MKRKLFWSCLKLQYLFKIAFVGGSLTNDLRFITVVTIYCYENEDMYKSWSHYSTIKTPFFRPSPNLTRLVTMPYCIPWLTITMLHIVDNIWCFGVSWKCHVPPLIDHRSLHAASVCIVHTEYGIVPPNWNKIQVWTRNIAIETNERFSFSPKSYY